MRLYEVVDVVPGVSLTLQDAIEGGEVTVESGRECGDGITASLILDAELGEHRDDVLCSKVVGR